MMTEIKCISCDMLIKPPKDPIVTSKRSSKPKHVTGPVEIRAVRRYFLKESDIEDVLVNFKYQLPFCQVCMDLVKKICDFEDEIIHLRQLIDSMVSCLKMKVQVSLDIYRPTDQDIVRLRASMLGERSWEDKYGHLVRDETVEEVKGDHEDEEEEEEESTIVPQTSAAGDMNEESNNVESSQVSELCQVEMGDMFEEHEVIAMDVPETVVTASEGQDTLAASEAPMTRPTRAANPKYADFVSLDSDIEDERDEQVEEKVQEEQEEEEVEHEDENYEDFEGDEEEEYYDEMRDEELDELLDLPERNTGDKQSKRVVMEFEPKKYRFEGVTFSLLEDQKYECDECHKVLKTRGGALIHIKNVHLSPREQKRRGRQKNNAEELPSYKRRKTERRQRPVITTGPDQFEFQGHAFSRREDGRYQCGTCPNILKTRDSVLVHIKQRHLGEGLGTFLCHLCGKSFDRDVYLKVHEINHLNPKSLHCDICGKAFTQYANLYNHKKIHTGQLNFHCEFENCGKKFLTRKQLTTHVRRHTGDRPYKCELCPKRFVRGSELTIHLRSHSEDRPFECHLCDSKFFIKGRLKRHLKNVHKIDTIGETIIEAVPQESIIIEVPTTQVQVDPTGQPQFTVQAATHYLTLSDIYTAVS